MNKKTLVRIGFVLFLFTVGYLIGGGIAKTIRYYTHPTTGIQPSGHPHVG